MAGDELPLRGPACTPADGDHASTDREGTEWSDLGEATPQGSRAPRRRFGAAPGRAAVGCTAALVALAVVAAWHRPLRQRRRGAGIGHVISAGSRTSATYSVEWYQLGCGAYDYSDPTPAPASGYSGYYAGSLSSDGGLYATSGWAYDANGNPSSYVRVYQNSEETGWTQAGADIPCGSNADFSAFSYWYSVCGDGSTIAVATYGTTASGGASTGYVRVYRYYENAWNQVGDDIDCGAASGIYLSLSTDGSTCAIGAYANDGTGSKGYVRVYHLDQPGLLSWNQHATWTQKGSDVECNAVSGYSWFYVSMCGNGDAFAIETYSGGSGYVQVYQYEDETWTQKGADIECEARDGFSGSAVTLSADGSTCAIGAYGKSASAEYISVYRYAETSSWTKLGSDIDGEASANYSRFSFSLSEDGSTVRVYQYGSSSPAPATTSTKEKNETAHPSPAPAPRPHRTTTADCDADCAIGGETYSCKVRLAWLMKNGPGSDENHYSKHSGPPGGEISCSNYLLKVKHECPSCENCTDSVACP
ncbi:unnamed protein product [Prorocentrum cordatum]|uniref:Subtilisin n=1 Tax=Prorocentrum cordatum TaxID=2364126 RepID=A0ABN9WYK5_9DINO|nr:unnamed protein product [Polarella glacialis]